MTKSSMLGYKIFLAVFLTLSIILLIVVLVQAGPNKQDIKTFNEATSIANDLNNYIDTNQAIPYSLSQVGAGKIPSSISYQELTDSSYKFCVDYKANSSGFDPSGTGFSVITGSSGGAYDQQYGDNNTLFIDNVHTKGENCQTITPFSDGGGECLDGAICPEGEVFPD